MNPTQPPLLRDNHHTHSFLVLYERGLAVALHSSPLCLAALVPELTVRTKLRGRKLSKAKDLKAQALGSEGAAYAAKHPPPATATRSN